MDAFEIIEHSQDSDNWKRWRRGKIGASDAAIIMGVSKWGTLLSLYEEKNLSLDKEQNEAMRQGKEVEKIVRDAYNYQNMSRYTPVCMESKLYPWMSASLDGWLSVPHPFDHPRIMEIKNASEEDHLCAINGYIPKHYYPQVQHQFVVAGEEKCLYLSHHKGQTIKVLVEKNSEYCADLVQREKNFYENHMIVYKAPEPCDKDFVDRRDDSALILARSYHSVDAKIKELEQEKKEIRKALLEGCSHPRIRITDLIFGEMKIKKDIVRGHIDYDAVSPEMKKILEGYRKPSYEKWSIYT